MRRRVLAASILVLGMTPRFVAAEGPRPSLDLRNFRPPANAQSGLYFEPAASPRTFDWTAAMWLSYAYRPVTLRDPAGEIAFRVIEHQLSSDLTASVGIAERAEVGLDLPFLLYQTGDSPTADSTQVLGDVPIPGQALGDLGILGKLTLVRPTAGEFGGFALGLHERFTVPTGDETSYLGEGAVTSETRLLAEYRLLALSVHAAAGVKLRAEREAYACADLPAEEAKRCPTRFGHELPFGVSFAVRPQAFGIDPKGRWTWFVEGHGHLPIAPRAPFEERLVSSFQVGLGARLALRNFSLLAGVETATFGGVGTGPLRAVLSAAWAPRFHDADSDGVEDDVDMCRDLAEDPDHFEDSDGCPDGDNDDDGVPDKSDRCPKDLEDEDEFQDDDGCPDPDNDGDRIADVRDACPNEAGPESADAQKNGCLARDPDNDGIEGEKDGCPDAAEDKDQFKDDDGCPDPDNDSDGITDTEDACRDAAGPPAENPKENGCPDPDPDHDAIFGAEDRCPADAEVYNTIDDDDGCPDGDPKKPAKLLATVRDTKDGPVVEMAAGVKFADQSEIDKVSMPLLRALAAELMKHPGWSVAVGVRPAPKGGPNEALMRAFALVDALRKLTRREGVAETGVVGCGEGFAARGRAWGGVDDPDGRGGIVRSAMLSCRTHFLTSWLLAAALGFSLCGLAPSATAQARLKVEVRKREGPQQPAAANSEGRTLRGLSGLPVAKELVDSDDVSQRIRGITRLGAIGTPEAIDVLLEQFEQGSSIARDPRTSLEAVRALAPHAARENVRQVLVREMTDSAADGRGTLSPLNGLAQNTAALALARSGDKKALAALVNAVLQGGTAGEAAAAAIRAYPPVSLLMLLEGRKRVAPALATLLGDVGDLRALERLRKMLAEPDPAAQIAAAVALAKLGDDAPIKMARQWLTRADTRLQRAAAEVLVYLGAPDAPKAIEVLLASDSGRSDGLRLALMAPSPAIAKALARTVALLPEEDRATGAAALGRAGGPDAAGLLIGLLGNPDLSTPAAFALATLPGEEARHALERALTSKTAQSGAARRLVVRAAVVRALELGDAPAGLVAILEQMLATKDPADRAVAAFGLGSIGARPIAELIERGCPAAGSARGMSGSVNACDAGVIGAAARAALHLGADSLALFMPLLASAASEAGDDALSQVGVAAGVALLGDASGGAIATSQLAAWAESGGPLAPLAARALPMRDDDVTRGRIKRLLGGSDPVIRAHVALGLAWDREPDAVSLLTGAYRFEEDAAVRRAIVRALSQRKEIQRNATLVMARDLDADEDVRSLARSALHGRALQLVAMPQGAKVAWVSIIANDADAVPSVRGRSARIVRSDGLAFPVLSDPDGVLLVPALPMGPGSLLLAPAGGSGDAGRR